MEHIMEFFRNLREEKGLSQWEVASFLHITQQQYSRYENGESELPLRYFLKLVRFYDVSADLPLGRVAEAEKDPLMELEKIPITPAYSCGELMRDVLALSENGQQRVLRAVEEAKRIERKKLTE